ncbi:MAG: hypothetical protein V1798_10240 [Pseudomonadota bacterium]
MAGDVYLSLDMDWAPDFVLEDLRGLLGTARPPCTLFHTHKSPAVGRLLELKGVECSIHPDFTKTDDPEGRIAELAGMFPSAKGARCHRLYYHSGLLPIFHRAGLLYLSNDLRFLEPGLRPRFDWSGLIHLPIYWEDDVHAVYFGGAYDLQALNLEQEGLKVFNFHPIHIFLNTSDLAEYRRAKPFLADEAEARKRQQGRRGIRTLFLELLRRLEGNKPATLCDLAEEFARGNRYQGRFKDYVARLGKERTP